MDNTFFKLGLTGHPVGHSRSPKIHECFSKETGKALTYDLYDRDGEQILSFAEEAFEEGLDGFNVTVPHKNAIIPSLEKIDENALLIGAVNTCRRTQNGFEGFNTDYIGLKKALHVNDIKLSGKPVVVLGAGGAARACVVLAIKEKASKVYVVNRSLEHALKLVKEYQDKLSYKNIFAVYPSDIVKEGKPFICLQATSLGLKDTDPCPVEDDEFFELCEKAYDLIPTTDITSFQKVCGLHGVPCSNGIAMLVYQAAAAFEIWTGVKISEETANMLIKQL